MSKEECLAIPLKNCLFSHLRRPRPINLNINRKNLSKTVLSREGHVPKAEFDIDKAVPALNSLELPQYIYQEMQNIKGMQNNHEENERNSQTWRCLLRRTVDLSMDFHMYFVCYKELLNGYL